MALSITYSFLFSNEHFIIYIIADTVIDVSASPGTKESAASSDSIGSICIGNQLH